MEAEVASLRERLETRRMVERAKAHLMEATAMTEVQAFTLIQRMAMNYHLPLRNAAERILAEDRPSDRSDPGGDDPSFINPAAGI
jgi:response regulator NasT